MSGTTLPLSDVKARLSELGRRVSEQHERITVTRNGEAQFVLVSIDDLEGLEITLEVLSDEGAIGRIAESLASLDSGNPGATVAELRTDLARRRAGA
ncbi:MAG TPA: type II toxin-antitoxin system Phd/YefM family antitoxin [Pseudonocardiaceae bacterium]|jgi:prevent-host-death family protein|nr:type II toxin-antitoxin system Phd/YefM family antitoxin [Pseudonocardiaceae bacterium]